MTNPVDDTPLNTADGHAGAHEAPAPPAPPEQPAFEWDRDDVVILQQLARPDVRERIEQLLDRATSPAIGVDAAGRIYDVVFTLLGNEAQTQVLLNLIARGMRDPELLTALNGSVDEATIAWARSLVAMYGEYLQRARQLDGEEPLGWSVLNRWLNYNYATSKHRVTLELLRNDAGRFEIVDTPANVAGLANALIDTLEILPVPARADTLDPDGLTQLADRCTALAQSIREHTAAQQVAAADQPATAAD